MIQRFSKFALLMVLLLATTVSAFASGTCCDSPDLPAMTCHEVVVIEANCCCESHEPEETDRCGCVSDLPDGPHVFAVFKTNVLQVSVALHETEPLVTSYEPLSKDDEAQTFPPNKGPPRPPLFDSRSLRAPPALMSF